MASALFQSVLSIGGSSPVAFARTDHSGRPIPRRHPLTLIVFPASSPARALRIDGLCVLARLSSFQRTDCGAPGTPHPTGCAFSRFPPCRTVPERPRHMSDAARLGEPSEVTGTTCPCQPKKCAATKKKRAAELERNARARNCAVLPGRFPAVRTFREYLVPIRPRQVRRTRCVCFCPFRNTSNRPPIA